MKEDSYIHSEITGKILQSFFQVYNHIGFGFEKTIYISSMQIEMQKQGLKSEINKLVEIYYQTIDVGNYTSDIVVENSILLKLCSKENISVIDEQILYNHLKVSVLEVGLLLNFGLTPQHKRKVCTNDRKSNMS
jgi:GxxExxY protein